MAQQPSATVASLVSEVNSQTSLTRALKKLVSVSRRLVCAERATLFLVDRRLESLYAAISHGGGAQGAASHERLRRLRVPIDHSSLAGHAALTGPVLVANPYGDPRFDVSADVATGFRTRNLIAVPLRAPSVDGEGPGPVVAVLEAVNKQDADGSGGGFTEDDVAALVTVGTYTADTLHRLTLVATALRERTRVQHLLALLQKVSVSSSRGRLADVVDAVTDAATRLIQAQRVTLYLIDEGGRHLVIAASDDAEGTRIPLGVGLAGTCAASGQPLNVADAYKDPRFDPRVDIATGFRTSSVVCVPIINGETGAVLGVLQGINRCFNGASPLPAGFSGFAEGDEDDGEGEGSAGGELPALPSSSALPASSLYGNYSALPSVAPALTSQSSTSSASSSGSGGGALIPSPPPPTTPSSLLPVAPWWPFTEGDLEVMTGMAAHAAIALQSAVVLEEVERSRRMTAALLEVVQAQQAAGSGGAGGSAGGDEGGASAALALVSPGGKAPGGGSGPALGLASPLPSGSANGGSGSAPCTARGGAASSSPVAGLATKIVAAVASVLECDAVSIFMVDAVKQELWLLGSTRGGGCSASDGELGFGLPPLPLLPAFPVGTGLVGWVAATGVPLNLRDAASDAAFRSDIDGPILGLPCTPAGAATPARSAAAASPVSAMVWPVSVAPREPARRTETQELPTSSRGPGHVRPSQGLLAVVVATHKRRWCLARAVSANLMRQGAHVAGATSLLGGRVSSGALSSRSLLSPRGGGSSGLLGSPLPPAGGSSALLSPRGAAGTAFAPATGSVSSAFSTADEQAATIICSEVASVLHRRSVELALLRAIGDGDSKAHVMATVLSGAGGSDRLGSDANGCDVAGLLSPGGALGGGSGNGGSGPNNGDTTSEDIHVSLIASYADAGTSARLQGSINRRSSLEPVPPGASAAVAASSSGEGAATAPPSPAPGAGSSTSAVVASSPAGGAAEAAGGAPATPAPAAAPATPGVASLASPAPSGAPASTAAAPRTPALVSASSNQYAQADKLTLLDWADPLFSWSWNPFELPLTGLPAMLSSPLGTGASPASPPLAPEPDPASVALGEARLARAVGSMFRQFSLLKRFGIDDRKFEAFVKAVRAKYHPNPFHNFYHGVSVLHATFLILGTTTACEMLTYRDILGAMVASLAHDIDHPGHTNLFEINSLSPLALMYSDDAVLERHHAHTLFKILVDAPGGTDLFASLPAADQRGLRATILKAILGTDMAKHFGCVSELAERASRFQERLKRFHEARWTLGLPGGGGPSTPSTAGGSMGSPRPSAPPPLLSIPTASPPNSNRRLAVPPSASSSKRGGGGGSSAATSAKDDDDGMDAEALGAEAVEEGSDDDSDDDGRVGGVRGARGSRGGLSTPNSDDDDEFKSTGEASPVGTRGGNAAVAGGAGFHPNPRFSSPRPGRPLIASVSLSTTASPPLSVKAPGGPMSPATPVSAGPKFLKRSLSSESLTLAGTAASSSPGLLDQGGVARYLPSRRSRLLLTSASALSPAGGAGASGATNTPPSALSTLGSASRLPPPVASPLGGNSGASSTASGSGTPAPLFRAPSFHPSLQPGGTGVPNTPADVVSGPVAAAAAAAAAPANSSSALRGGLTSAGSFRLHAILGTPGGFPGTEPLPYDRSDEKERNDLVATIVHTADLSAQAYAIGVAKNWTSRIIAEFRQQAAKEAAAGLPVAPYMAHLDTPLQCARLQLSFVSNIVLPLWLRVSELLPGLSEPIQNLHSTRMLYEAEVAKSEKAEAAAAAAAAQGSAKP